MLEKAERPQWQERTDLAISAQDVEKLQRIGKALAHALRAVILAEMLRELAEHEARPRAQRVQSLKDADKTDDEVEDAVRKAAEAGKFSANFRGVSAKEMSERLGVSLGLCSYHMNKLRDECHVTEERFSQPVRGALEHFHRVRPEYRSDLEEIVGLAANLG